MKKLYIGTSGYSYGHWISRFYPKNLPQKSWLSYYCQFFNSVELNVTFYRLPKEEAFLLWYKETPVSFIFSVKGSRFITHVKKLKNVEEPVKLFMERASLLKEKLGVILWQFPKNFKLNLERLEGFLKILKKYKTRFVFEFRNESWFVKEVYNLLEKYNRALVIADSPQLCSSIFAGQAIWPHVGGITADFLYIRFHGPRKLYGSKYSKKELEDWAFKIKNWQKQAKDVYAYFNNDFQAFAVKNARQLKSLLSIEK